MKFRLTPLVVVLCLTPLSAIWAQDVVPLPNVPQLQTLATQGNAIAQFNLGVLHDVGRGVRQDYAQAVKWYRLAAAQGHAGAQFNLGGMYFEGSGVAQDYVRAYQWFTLAGVAGYAGAVKNRNSIATLMTPAQIAQAQGLARDCQRRNWVDCE